jgi:hypothetical protein
MPPPTYLLCFSSLHVLLSENHEEEAQSASFGSNPELSEIRDDINTLSTFCSLCLLIYFILG